MSLSIKLLFYLVFLQLTCFGQVAIDKIKAGIESLKGQLTNAGLSADVEASVLAQLDSIAAGFDAPEAPVEPEIAPVEPA